MKLFRAVALFAMLFGFHIALADSINLNNSLPKNSFGSAATTYSSSAVRYILVASLPDRIGTGIPPLQESRIHELPEPCTSALVGTGVLGIALLCRRRIVRG